MPSYQELIARKNELDKRIEAVRDTEAKDALATIKQLIDTFGFTVQQVFPWKPEEKKKVEALTRRRRHGRRASIARR